MLGCVSDLVPRLLGGVTVEHHPLARRHPPELMALPLTAPVIDAPSHENDPARLAPHRIKRCTYRRLISLDRARERVYEVECLYPDRRLPIPLGDLDSSLPICNACTAPHIFRADED